MALVIFDTFTCILVFIKAPNCLDNTLVYIKELIWSYYTLRINKDA